MEEKLNQMQEKCNKLYAKNGLTDEVLDLQIQINQLRHENNITDKSKRINIEGFVQ